MNSLAAVLCCVGGGSAVLKYVAPHLFESDMDELDQTWSPIPGMTLAPGEGAIFYNRPDEPSSLIITGTIHTSIVAQLVTSVARLYGTQTNDIGTYSKIVGAPPQEGTVLMKFNKWGNPFVLGPPNYLVFTFDNGAWSPSEPLANLGESVWIFQRPTISNVIASSTNFTFSFTSAEGQTNYVEYTDSVTPPGWQALTNFVGNGTVAQISTSVTNSSQRFFRVRNPPVAPNRYPYPFYQ